MDPLQAVVLLEEARKAGVDAKLVMLGKGSLEGKLSQCAAKFPNETVKLPGWQDPAPYFETADVVLCTSHYESWGANIVEALAAGVPVVAPEVGIAREAGAIVAERSDLAKKVVEVLKSGVRGQLRLSLLGEAEWARRWKETL